MPFDVRLKYTGVAKTLDKEFDRSFTVVPPRQGELFRILSPLFFEYGPYWLRTDGLLVPAERQTCLQSVRRVRDPGGLPMPMLYARLSADWKTKPLFQRFIWE
jgi:hypothetical protein